MEYILKLFNKDLLRFQVVQNLAKPVLSITWIDEKHRNLLPLGMEQTNEGLAEWIRHRSIPRNRAYVDSFLAKCGLSANRPMDVITVCKGLSLNDSYWVVPEEEKRTFEQCNLYDNRISNILAWIAFTGYGESSRSFIASSPEFTTNGMLPKCWRRVNGKLFLYKGGTSGASNTGNEPYSELYASQVGEKMGIRSVSYRTTKWKKQLCSVCQLFTSKDISYVPVGRIVKNGGMQAVREYYEALGQDYVQELNEMIVFDAIICNTDRHFGNFGFLVESHTNQIISPAPLFDHGNSLFNLAGSFWDNKEQLQEYADTLKPCVYESFMGEAAKYLDQRIKEKLRHLLTFQCECSGRINYSNEKRRLISDQVQKRARFLLEA